MFSTQTVSSIPRARIAHTNTLQREQDVDYTTKDVQKPVLGDGSTISYYLSITHCPGDDYPTGVDDHDPGHHFYDAAALLKYSITSNAWPKSKYNATVVALIHPEAIRCKDPSGTPYDRVRILQELGYKTHILGSPVDPRELHPSVRDEIGTDAGDRSMMPLHIMDYPPGPPVGSKYLFWSDVVSLGRLAKYAIMRASCLSRNSSPFSIS